MGTNEIHETINDMKDPANLVKNRKELTNEMLEKYGYLFCEMCMSTREYKYHCHHIMSRGRYPNHPMLHEKINLVIICDDCHELCHQKPEYNEKLIEKRNLRSIF
jgi:predicted HNH restriction endonuclease